MQLNYEELMNKIKQSHAKNNLRAKNLNIEKLDQTSMNPNIEEFMGLQVFNKKKQ
jgi:hypothetical protein